MERSQIEKDQIRKALRTLDVLKVNYTIKCDDGSLFGPLSDEVIFKPDEEVKRVRRSFSFLDMNTLILDMEVGEVRIHDFTDKIPEGFTLREIAGNMSATASRTWGNESFRYLTKGNVVECIRMA